MAPGCPPRQTPGLGAGRQGRKDPDCEDETIETESSRPVSSESERPTTGDREELIRRIKRGERPQWTPSEQLRRLLAENVNEDRDLSLNDNTPSTGHSHSSKSWLALHNKAHMPGSSAFQTPELDHSSVGLEIRRPRSALHAGDFDVQSTIPAHPTAFQDLKPGQFATSPPRPGPSEFPRPIQSIPKRSISLAFSKNDQAQTTPLRPRAPSQSASLGYILKPATSPLVRETRNNDLEEDFMEIDSPTRRNRRHTLTPIGSLPNTNDYSSLTHAARLPASLRKENSSPWPLAGQRRPLNASYSYQLASSPQTPTFSRSRAPSFSSDASPRQTSMVGSYEESILRGRMSGTPSQPLNFTAELGAVARNKYKPTCPAHVHVEFPAVYYSWPSGLGRVSSAAQEPSPYVGRIDLEHNLAPPKMKEERRRHRRAPSEEDDDVLNELELNKNETRLKKRKRRARSPKDLPLGGCYRIPQQGSLQIIIRNPNKSAAKVFIVPYDLDGMTQGTKTWVRQRCYSAGPIIESPISSSRGKQSPADVKSKPTLRYLIHVKICSPSKGRFFLYDEIRVVFANRVPDDKENLRYEVQMPDPKFTDFRPQQRRRSLASTDSSILDAPETDDDRALRRRSYGLTMSSSAMRCLPALGSGPQSTSDLTCSTPVPALPSSFIARPRSFTTGTFSEQDTTDGETVSSGSLYLQSPTSDLWGRRALSQVSSPEKTKDAGSRGRSLHGVLGRAMNGASHGDESRFAKLKQEDNRYGGAYGRPATPEPGEGLIARRLRSLEVDEHDDKDDL